MILFVYFSVSFRFFFFLFVFYLPTSRHIFRRIAAVFFDTFMWNDWHGEQKQNETWCQEQWYRWRYRSSILKNQNDSDWTESTFSQDYYVVWSADSFNVLHCLEDICSSLSSSSSSPSSFYLSSFLHVLSLEFYFSLSFSFRLSLKCCCVRQPEDCRYPLFFLHSVRSTREHNVQRQFTFWFHADDQWRFSMLCGKRMSSTHKKKNIGLIVYLYAVQTTT